MGDNNAGEPADISEAPEHRQQQLYFGELFQLKVRCEYMRRYRDVLSAWVTRFAILRAVASSGGIAGWVIWREYAFVWGTIIAASQVADALTSAIPYTARQKAANALLADLDALLIEVLFACGGVRRSLHWHFPTGDLPNRPDLLALAEQDAIAYLEAMFRERTQPA